MKRSLIRYWTQRYDMVEFYGRKVKKNHYQEVDEFGLVTHECYINDWDVVAILKVGKCK